MDYQLRDFTSADAHVVNQIAIAAFEQYQDEYQNWPAFALAIGKMSDLAASAEIIIAEVDGQRAASGHVP